MTSTATRTAYDLLPAAHDTALTEVRKGTPMGELLRRYWHPVGLAADASSTPRGVRVLGEDLVLFRDGGGRAGLVHARCAHRGASLVFGRVDHDGIRCAYHGWKFDVVGACLDQPCERQGGELRHKVWQPHYPVEERYGLVWAYLGPTTEQPLLPRYSTFENLAEGEQLYTDDTSIGGGGPAVLDFNWLQHYENVQDPAHLVWLHYFHSGPQFGKRNGEFDRLDFAPWQWMERLSSEAGADHVTSRHVVPLPDGRAMQTVVQTVLPTVRVVPNPLGGIGPSDHLGFVLPIDDTHFRIYTVLRGRDRRFFDQVDKLRAVWADATPEHRRNFPSDYEVQRSQGCITLHSEEHLFPSDRAIAMLRRLLRAQVQAVASGQRAAGTAFEPGSELVTIRGGVFPHTGG